MLAGDSANCSPVPPARLQAWWCGGVWHQDGRTEVAEHGRRFWKAFWRVAIKHCLEEVLGAGRRGAGRGGNGA